MQSGTSDEKLSHDIMKTKEVLSLLKFPEKPGRLKLVGNDTTKGYRTVMIELNNPIYPDNS